MGIVSWWTRRPVQSREGVERSRPDCYLPRMNPRQLRQLCIRCRYPLRPRDGGPIGPDVASHFPKCNNKACPTRPVCPKCGSKGIHEILLFGGHMQCRECHETFDPREQRPDD